MVCQKSHQLLKINTQTSDQVFKHKTNNRSCDGQNTERRDIPEVKVRPAGRAGELVYVIFPFAPLQATMSGFVVLLMSTVRTTGVVV